MNNKHFLVFGIAFLLITIILMPTVLSANQVRPSELTISVSDSTPDVGDTVTVTLTEIPYESDVDYVWFGADVYHGDVVIRDNLLDRNMIFECDEQGTLISGNKYQATFSFVPDEEGAITIDVYAHRQYDVTFADAQIYVNPAPESETSDQTGNSDASGNNGNTGIPGFEIILIICAFALVLFWKRKK